MPLLEQDIKRKESINKLLKLEPEFDVGNNKKYKLEIIKNSAVYAIKLIGQLLRL